jgi:hypothetical protein
MVISTVALRIALKLSGFWLVFWLHAEQITLLRSTIAMVMIRVFFMGVFPFLRLFAWNIDLFTG